MTGTVIDCAGSLSVPVRCYLNGTLQRIICEDVRGLALIA